MEGDGEDHMQAADASAPAGRTPQVPHSTAGAGAGAGDSAAQGRVRGVWGQSRLKSGAAQQASRRAAAAAPQMAERR